MQKNVRWSLACAALVGALAIALTTAPVAGRAAATNRTVYVSLIDKSSGTPVTDAQAADLEVKEGGKTMEIVSIKPATTPLRIAIIDSDAGYGAFQAGIGQFMQKLLGKAEFSITSVIVQPKKVIDFSSDAATLSKALTEIGPRGVQKGGQLMEAISEATKDLRAEGKRSIMLVTRVGAEGATSMQSRDVRDRLRKTGATMYVVAVKGAANSTQATSSATKMGTEQQQVHDDEATESSNNLEQVLGDGSKESGGRYDEVVSVAAAKLMAALGDEILQTYEVVYAVPDGTKPSDKLQVSTKRKNVNVYAPSRPPQ